MPSDTILRYGAYLCLNDPETTRSPVGQVDVPGLADRFGLKNEFDVIDGHPANAVAYIRRVDADPGSFEDHDLLSAGALVHVASSDASIVNEYCAAVTRLIAPPIRCKVLSGVVRPTMYTGNAMHQFAYAKQLGQQAAAKAPHAFLIPWKKNREWWAKDWMERHTYFLPRYDQAGNMVNEGHALAAAPGVECLMRRTYKSDIHPAPDGMYDFINYFECGDGALTTFREVCSALRDVERNPEWTFVQEGPTWQGRRVATWDELFA